MPKKVNLTIQAYNKLKAYVYAENTNLFLRARLAEFEAAKTFEEKLDAFQAEVELLLETKVISPYFENFINEINFRTLPKKIEGQEIEKGQPFVISNDTSMPQYELLKSTFLIDCPIELHLVSIIWIMKLGKDLDSKLDDNLTFGYRLQKGELDEHGDPQRKLFVPYFQNYQQWRDRGIQIAKDLHTKGIGSTILTLDIQNYFYSVDLDIRELAEHFNANEAYGIFNDLLALVHKQYRKRLNATKELLPIGLLSSGIIANHILAGTDSEICKQLKPAYYGRYVDDFFVVLPHMNIASGGDILEKLIDSLKIYPIFNLEDERALKLNNDFGDFRIQFEKVKIINLNASHPLRVLEEFERKIRETSSEARLLVEDADLLSKFDSESSNIVYSDSINKLRSIDAFNMNKLGASSYLTNLIEAAKITHRMSKEDMLQLHLSVKSYFKGVKGIESYNLWEKIITFYVIQDQPEFLLEFITSVLTEIFRIRKHKNFKLPHATQGQSDHSIETQTTGDLMEWISNCLGLAYSLHPKLMQNTSLLEFLARLAESEPSTMEGVMLSLAASMLRPRKLLFKALIFRRSNLLRHKYVTYPLTNYCKDHLLTSLTDTNFKPLTYQLDLQKLKFSARFIPFQEVQLFIFYRQLVTGKKRVSDRGVVKRFIAINGLQKKASTIYESFPKIDTGDTANSDIQRLKISYTRQSHANKIRIGIANVKLDIKDSVDALLGNPNLHYDRLRILNKLLNNAIEEEVQLILLPETSIPIQWVDYLAKFSQKHNIGLIFGLEHIVGHKKRVANLLCHILPFRTEMFTSTSIFFRNKDNYSPEELRWLDDMKLKKWPSSNKIQIFDWCGLHFTTFNCFEVTDITKRAKIVSEVDLVNIVENNQDTEYFSNIVESISRDVHAIVAQVNNSAYGDSRICIPAKTFQKDQLRIRGGINPIVLVEEINVYELRLFQQFGKSSSNIVLSNEKYKPLPPNYITPTSRKLKKAVRKKK